MMESKILYWRVDTEINIADQPADIRTQVAQANWLDELENNWSRYNNKLRDLLKSLIMIILSEFIMPQNCYNIIYYLH